VLGVARIPPSDVCVRLILCTLIASCYNAHSLARSTVRMTQARAAPVITAGNQIDLGRILSTFIKAYCGSSQVTWVMYF
jgi:hypothetical protein